MTDAPKNPEDESTNETEPTVPVPAETPAASTRRLLPGHESCRRSGRRDRSAESGSARLRSARSRHGRSR